MIALRKINLPEKPGVYVLHRDDRATYVGLAELQPMATRSYALGSLRGIEPAELAFGERRQPLALEVVLEPSCLAALPAGRRRPHVSARQLHHELLAPRIPINVNRQPAATSTSPRKGTPRLPDLPPRRRRPTPRRFMPTSRLTVKTHDFVAVGLVGTEFSQPATATTVQPDRPPRLPAGLQELVTLSLLMAYEEHLRTEDAAGGFVVAFEAAGHGVVRERFAGSARVSR